MMRRMNSTASGFVVKLSGAKTVFRNVSANCCDPLFFTSTMLANRRSFAFRRVGFAFCIAQHCRQETILVPLQRPERDVSSHREADDHRAFKMQMIHERKQIINMSFDGVLSVRRRRSVHAP